MWNGARMDAARGWPLREVNSRGAHTWPLISTLSTSRTKLHRYAGRLHSAMRQGRSLKLHFYGWYWWAPVNWIFLKRRSGIIDESTGVFFTFSGQKFDLLLIVLYGFWVGICKNRSVLCSKYLQFVKQCVNLRELCSPVFVLIIEAEKRVFFMADFYSFRPTIDHQQDSWHNSHAPHTTFFLSSFFCICTPIHLIHHIVQFPSFWAPILVLQLRRRHRRQ
jgi:hypothetical protein